MLSNTFLKYITRTSNVCIYQFKNQTISPTLQFPNARTVTLINCSREGVNRILTPSIFPNIDEVHYLSAHPGQVDIYQRFPKLISWIFPNSEYIFYKCMIEAGLGYVDNRLISNYIYSVDQSGANLYIPQYGLTIGESYCKRLHHYLRYQHYPIQSEIDQFDEELFYSATSPFLQEYVERAFYNIIMNNCKKEEKALIKNKTNK